MRPYDQRVIAPMARPSTEDLNSARSADAYRLGFLAQQLFARATTASNSNAFYTTGFLGSGFKVQPSNPAALSVDVLPGLGYYFDETSPLVIATDSFGQAYQGVTDESPMRPLVCPTRITIPLPLPLPPVGQSRYDIIEVRPKRELQDFSSILRWDVGANNWAPGTVATFLRYAIEQGDLGYVLGSTTNPSASLDPISYVQGPPAATGTQLTPQGSPGYLTIARILVSNGVASIGADKIVDARRLIPGPSGNEIVMTVEVDVTQLVNPVLPVITAYDAPPGVEMVVRGDLSEEAQLQVYLLGGSAFTITHLYAQSLYGPGDADELAGMVQPQVRPISSVLAVTGPIQSALIGAFTANPQSVGIGQTIRQYAVKTNLLKNDMGAATLFKASELSTGVMRYELRGLIA